MWLPLHIYINQYFQNLCTIETIFILLFIIQTTYLELDLETNLYSNSLFIQIITVEFLFNFNSTGIGIRITILYSNSNYANQTDPNIISEVQIPLKLYTSFFNICNYTIFLDFLLFTFFCGIERVERFYSNQSQALFPRLWWSFKLSCPEAKAKEDMMCS